MPRLERPTKMGKHVRERGWPWLSGYTSRKLTSVSLASHMRWQQSLAVVSTGDERMRQIDLLSWPQQISMGSLAGPPLVVGRFVRAVRPSEINARLVASVCASACPQPVRINYAN